MTAWGFWKARLTVWTLFALVVCLSRTASAADYFVSPTGLDTNAGSSPASAWLTFDHALGHLQPGDRLLLVDGHYTRATTGLPEIDCSSPGGNASNGTPASPITIAALNERQAHLDTSSVPGEPHRAFTMLNCSYWKIEGLRVQGTQGLETGVILMIIAGSDHIEMRRLLLHGSNTCNNSHLLGINICDEVLVEESEFYNFHRHAVHGFHSTNLTYRRNYVNGDNGLATCLPFRPNGRMGDEPLSFYPADLSLMENNVTESSTYGLTASASDEITGLDAVGIHDNLWLGNVTLNAFRGIQVHGRCWEAPEGSCPWVNQGTNNHIENNVFYFDKAFRQAAWGMVIGDQIAFTAVNNSVLGSEPKSMGSGISGVITQESSEMQTGQSASITNTLVTHTITSGFDMTAYEDDPEATWAVSSLNIFNNRDTPAAKPAAAEATATDIDPELGGCIVFIPESSPMSGAGADGEDIGANVLFRYQDGVLTDRTLWDATTGAFPCGAIVPGVNDIAGASCSDVHERLHVNSGGCSLPDWYDSDADGIRNRGDNCSGLANLDQADDDGDGFGNRCDCDLDQDGACTLLDRDAVFKDLCIANPGFVSASLDCAAFLAAAGNNDPSGRPTDLDSDGDVDWADAAILIAAQAANGGEPGPGAGGLGDSDDDGFADNEDSCPFTANPSQIDEDADGAGNACDCDFNQDGLCDLSDALRFLNDFCAYNPDYNEAPINCTATQNQSQGPETDMNGDGMVSLEDSSLFDAAMQNGSPGPGAVVPEDVAVNVAAAPSAVPALPGGAGIALLALALLGLGDRWLRSRTQDRPGPPRRGTHGDLS